MRQRTIFAMLIISATAVGTLVLPMSSAALADRCEPDEVIVRQIPGFEDYESPDDPADYYSCMTMDNVYLILGCDDTTLMRCIDTLDPDDFDPNEPACRAYDHTLLREIFCDSLDNLEP